MIMMSADNVLRCVRRCLHFFYFVCVSVEPFDPGKEHKKILLIFHERDEQTLSLKEFEIHIIRLSTYDAKQ